MLVQRPLFTLPLLGATLLSWLVHLASLAVPGLRPIFHTYPLATGDWLLVVLLSACIVPAVEVAKLLGRPLLRPDR